jgi:transglutaminase-like putative cysteine protease
MRGIPGSLLLSGLLLALGIATMVAAAPTATPSTSNRPGPNHRPQGANAPHELRAEFSYTVALEKLSDGAKTLELWLPAPSDDPWQKVEDLKVEGAPFRIAQERRYGNRMAYVKLSAVQLPLTLTERFTIDRKEMRVLAADTSGTAGPAKRIGWIGRSPLIAEPYIPVGGRYKTEAEEVTAGKTTPLDRARALYDHIVATTQYDYKHESPQYAVGDAAFVCDYKKGNCSDLHSYFLALARSVGIESQLVYGLPIGGVPVPDPLPAEGKITSYHCWVLFRDPQRGWVPLDAADGRRWLDAGNETNKDYDFGNLFVTRSAVLVSRGRNLTLAPSQHGGTLNNFITPYAEVDGKPVAVKTEIRYRMLSHQ